MRYDGMARFQHRKLKNGDLGPVEVKMKQIIEEQDAVNMDKDEDRSRQARFQNLESCLISGSANSVLKINEKSKLASKFCSTCEKFTRLSGDIFVRLWQL